MRPVPAMPGIIAPPVLLLSRASPRTFRPWRCLTGRVKEGGRAFLPAPKNGAYDFSSTVTLSIVPEKAKGGW